MTTADTQTEVPILLVDDPDGYIENTGWVQVTEKTPDGASAVAVMEDAMPRADHDEDTAYFCDDKQVCLVIDAEKTEETGEQHWKTATDEHDTVVFWEITVGCPNG